MKFIGRWSVRAASLVLLGAASIGCTPESQVASMVVPDSKGKQEVLDAAVTVLKERFHQVRVYGSTGHVVAFSPVFFDGNQPARKKIDVYVLQENGYYMPKVWVRRFVDVSDPEVQSGPITGRFPSEVNFPAPADDWRPLGYDRSEEQEIRKAILGKLEIL